MFLDELTIHLKAGRGGNGVVRWLNEKGREFGGPAGGDGGRGGHIYMKGIRDIGALLNYRHVSRLSAEDGSPGANKSQHGKDAKDITVSFPLGSVVTNLKTGEAVELLNENENLLLLKGGAGGRGNEHFKSSVNRNPEEWTPGKNGEEADFSIELQLIADAGLIGLPNAGKTSLLNVLTNAEGKVGSYAFTTLEPNLGDCYGRILADIPGLIEGAAEGKGLGDKFLRHIRRTGTLLHCVSLENENLVQAYTVVRDELGQYDEKLLQKDEWILLTKSDMVDAAHVSKAIKELEQFGKTILTVSILDDISVKDLRDALVKGL